MERCRTQYFKEVDIVEHIMQFREVKAEMENRADEGKTHERRSFFRKARTKVLSLDEGDDEQSQRSDEVVQRFFSSRSP